MVASQRKSELLDLHCLRDGYSTIRTMRYDTTLPKLGPSLLLFGFFPLAIPRSGLISDKRDG